MAGRQRMCETSRSTNERGGIGAAVRAAVGRGLVIGRRVRLGRVDGVVIGYNIARRGRYRGERFPLLINTELGVAKCGLEEVVAV